MIAIAGYVRRRWSPGVWNVTRAAMAVLIALFLAQFLYVYTGSYRLRSAEDWWDGLVPALRIAAEQRRPGEQVRMRADSGHYAYWMFVTDPAPERILEHRDRVRAGAGSYDHLDRDNRYGFLDFRTVPQGRGTIGEYPGLWVLPRAAIDPRRLDELERRGAIESLYANDGYSVLRVAGP